MSKARVAVLKVISKELSVTAAAAEFGYSRRHLHRLLARYKRGGIEAVDPKSRRPKTSPQATSNEIRTGELLSTHHIHPQQTYWRNTQRPPGRWPRGQT